MCIPTNWTKRKCLILSGTHNCRDAKLLAHLNRIAIIYDNTNVLVPQSTCIINIFYEVTLFQTFETYILSCYEFLYLVESPGRSSDCSFLRGACTKNVYLVCVYFHA